jgi:hypothetical protein
MIGTTSELDEALRSARRKGIGQIITSDGGWPAIWYVRVAIDPETTKTMISIAGLNDYWDRTGDPLDTCAGWYHLADRGVGRVSIQELRDQSYRALRGLIAGCARGIDRRPAAGRATACARRGPARPGRAAARPASAVLAATLAE